ncbi:hypothetical protein MMC16_007323 [Acarospora aff. strigata]|nr:hypothetical protein [Acarospora aff. strigata]
MDKQLYFSVNEILEEPWFRKILVVVTAGGKTNAAPLLEIAKILNSRGHIIEFGTLQGQEQWVKDCPFVSRVHILGPGVPPEVEEASYLQMTSWRAPSLKDDWAPIFDTRKFLESSWEFVYPSLSALMKDPSSRPDFILSDYLVDAVRDMAVEHDIPICMHWPQMPTNMLPASYIPGVPGLQVEVLTSEHATLWQRLKNELGSIRALPAFLKYRRWLRTMRASAGVTRMLPSTPKPDYLLLVNSFFGLATPKDLPPNVAAVGPILPDTYPPLTDELQTFVQTHKKILYIALGTHVLLRDATLRLILAGVASALDSGAIDGVIWSIRGMARAQFTLGAAAPGHLSTQYTIADLLDGQHPSILFLAFAPQRALLDHPHTALYITHAGTSSTNEAAFHGIPVISIAVYFDQLQNAMRLRDAGVAVALDKTAFTAHELSAAIERIVRDDDGMFARNVQRLKRIARIASRRKGLAADLCEEVLADHEGRHYGNVGGGGGGGGGRCERPMHLQTADMRMPGWKVRNWDLYACVGALIVLGVGIVVVVPVALGLGLGLGFGSFVVSDISSHKCTKTEFKIIVINSSDEDEDKDFENLSATNLKSISTFKKKTSVKKIQKTAKKTVSEASAADTKSSGRKTKSDKVQAVVEQIDEI